MTANIGNLDRIIRAVLGVILLAIGTFAAAGTGQILAFIVGVVLLATAGMRFCAAYRIFGISTCKL